MGKKKIDKLRLIENKLQRNVAFCKRKRGFLKKAIELSCLCDQQILIIIYDQERHRLVQFSSEENFQIEAAYNAIKVAKLPENKASYEKFTNDDYQRLEMLDFRSVRYKKKHMFDEEAEFVSDFEDQAQEDIASNQQSLVNFDEKIEPKNNHSSNERKQQKTEENQEVPQKKQSPKVKANTPKSEEQPDEKVIAPQKVKSPVIKKSSDKNSNDIPSKTENAKQSDMNDPSEEQISALQQKVLSIITDGKQFEPWPPELVQQIEFLQQKLLAEKDQNVEQPGNLVASFLQDLLQKQITDKQGGNMDFQPQQFNNMPQAQPAETPDDLFRRQVLDMLQKNQQRQQPNQLQQHQQLAQLLLQQSQNQNSNQNQMGAFIPQETTMGGNQHTPMFQTLDNKLTPQIQENKMEFNGWNSQNQSNQNNNLKVFKNESHSFNIHNQQLFTNLKKQMQARNSPNLNKLAPLRDRAVSNGDFQFQANQNYQQMNFMNQLLNQGQNKNNAFDTDSQISNLSMIGRSNLQQQLQQKIFSKSPQTYGMSGPEKQPGNLTPRETRVEKECDGMSDFLGQQEHFQNQFDKKKPKDGGSGYFE